ncbi:MAG: c-type cytochrome [Chitinophagaceae bacterium]|jgi:cytochrome c|nr:MAG: c-type cytochrome [Chitinophagaceae bacterium]
MKKTILALGIAAFMIGCGSGDDKATTNADSGTPAKEAKADVSQHPDYKKGLALIGQSDCLTCHKVSEKVVGPSYQEVADRYAGQAGIEDSLAGKIIHGGAGNWGQVPMTPHPNLSQDDAVAMVKYILLLKQQ